MKRKYLLRFDDLCPTMNWEIWDEIERLLDSSGISPLLAVVPDNRDPLLEVGAPNPEFWERVRDWQKKGWTIALHGYQHTYHNRNGGIVGINRFGEFAGRPHSAQASDIKKGLKILHSAGVTAKAWVAPAHSFDRNTIDILRSLDIGILSDGLFRFPHHRWGVLWIPQQLWRFRKMPAGVWTVCNHHNSWTSSDLHALRVGVEQFKQEIASIPEIAEAWEGEDMRLVDRILPPLGRTAIRVRRTTRRIWR